MTESRARSPRVRVIGLGNPYRHDDAVGLHVAREVRRRCRGEADVWERESFSTSTLQDSRPDDGLILIDAASSGEPPGTIQRLDASLGPLPEARSFRGSTHAISVSESIELARALGPFPARLIVYAIEGEDFALGEGLSPRVTAAVSETVERVLRELRSMVEA